MGVWSFLLWKHKFFYIILSPFYFIVFPLLLRINVCIILGLIFQVVVILYVILTWNFMKEEWREYKKYKWYYADDKDESGKH